MTRGVAALGVTAGNYAAASAWAGHSASAAGRDQLLIKLGTARKEAGPAAWPIIDLRLPETDQAVTPETFGFRLNWQNLRQAHRREGSYLLRSNLTGGDPAQLWAFYLQPTEVDIDQSW